MRNSEVLHKKTNYIKTIFQKKESRTKLLRNYFFVLTLIFFFSSTTLAQWNNNSAVNTNLVIGTVDPNNLKAVQNPEGGIFLTWQDTKANQLEDVFFLHFDFNGNATLRADGKRISNQNVSKINPIISNSLDDAAVVLWKSVASPQNEILTAQKIKSNGFFFWSDEGVEISDGKKEIINYSVVLDKDANTHIAFIEKEKKIPSEYFVRYQKITADGNIAFSKGGMKITSSFSAMNLISIKADEDNQPFIFWVGHKPKNNLLLAQRINKAGRALFSAPMLISGLANNVLKYQIVPVTKNLFYAVWKNQVKQRTIFHQMFNAGGTVLWEANGRAVNKIDADQSNVQAVLASDTTVIVSWILQKKNERKIFANKFRPNGKSLWGENGIAISQTEGEQFGQNIIADKIGGAIISWLDKKVGMTQPNILAQRLNRNGLVVWDSKGVPIATFNNSEKSYHNLIGDLSGGAIAIFREKRKNIVGIFGQQVVVDKTYAAQINDFDAIVEGSSVKLSWKTIDEKDIYRYHLERLVSHDDDNNEWKEITTFLSSAERGTNSYNFTDVPEESGTIYYRIVQRDRSGNKQFSDLVKVNFISPDIDNIVVYQNTPNPFSDSTEITFFLPRKQSVKIEFYNSRVEQISETVINDTHQGKNSFIFYANDLSDGVYFYRVKVGNFVEVKKMVIAKN